MKDSFRWRIFRQPVIAEPNNVVKFMKATIALHNYLWTEEGAIYCPSGYADRVDKSGNALPGAWRGKEPGTGPSPIGSVSSNRYVHAQ